jgi:hypothetical protein
MRSDTRFEQTQPYGYAFSYRDALTQSGLRAIYERQLSTAEQS